jgi:excinuclease ABC subunit A
VSNSFIRVRGAREHNLKNVSIDIPKDRLVVITGLSGSGKSTLAFDTLYAEGQRRYVESLSAYARQFLNLMPKPDVDSIEGLCPAISIEQKSISKNPRSTVGTITEIYDYMRLLFARIGVPYSPATGLPIRQQTISNMVDIISAFPAETNLYLLSPTVNARKGEYKNELLFIKHQGFSRVLVDEDMYLIDEVPDLSRNKRHSISIVIDRITISETPEDMEDLRQRLANSIEIALKYSNGIVIAKNQQSGKETIFSEKFACPVSGFCIEEIEPRLFSFNNPKGACKNCGGLGVLSDPFKIAGADQNELDAESHFTQTEIICPVCNGARLSQEALAIKIAGKNISEVSNMSILGSLQWFTELEKLLSVRDLSIAEKVLVEIKNRLGFLLNVGLEYLTISRSSRTLSGGESQRIRLASQIGSGLTGVLYVLDEPSIGLHQRDNMRLIDTLKALQNYGNSVVVVEHDEDTMRAADFIIDIGPRAGVHGGEIVAFGTIDDVKAQEASLTGQYLSGRKFIAVPSKRRNINLKKAIKITNAYGNNLKNVSVDIPLGVFVCVTGVSGSGKSTLILDTLYRAIFAKITHSRTDLKNVDAIQGITFIDKIIDINQSPIGRTPRSNPATYIGCFSDIRTLFASLPEAKARGYSVGRFSFNIKGGRCEACKGDGVTKIEMHFLPDVYVTCDKCNGKRYNRETLEIKFKGRSISDILDMTIDEGCELFKYQPIIFQKIQCLSRVGLGYLTIGHKATLLSGGEAQRVKLAKELSKKATGSTLYILDEPTTGLHIDDVKKLLEILHLLVDQGNSVIVIEHNLDVIKTADWVIDIGAEGGERGGNIVAVGPPEEICKKEGSYTGQYLRHYLPFTEKQPSS